MATSVSTTSSTSLGRTSTKRKRASPSSPNLINDTTIKLEGNALYLHLLFNTFLKDEKPLTIDAKPTNGIVRPKKRAKHRAESAPEQLPSLQHLCAKQVALLSYNKRPRANTVLQLPFGARQVLVEQLALVDGLSKPLFRPFVGDSVRHIDFSWMRKHAELTMTHQLIVYILRNCPRVTTINLAGCSAFVTDELLSELISFCPELQYLDLSNCTKLTTQAIVLIIKCCTNLNTLRFCNCYQLADDPALDMIHWAEESNNDDDDDYERNLRLTQDESLMHINDDTYNAAVLPMVSDSDDEPPPITLTADDIATFAQIDTIDLSDCHYITDGALEKILSSQYSLRVLNLTHCSRVTDNTLKWIAEQEFSMLEEIYLDSCGLSSPEAIIEFVRLTGHNLRALDLSYHRKITIRVLQAIGHYCPKLVKLVLNHTTGSPASDNTVMKQFCPALETLSLKQCTPLLSHQLLGSVFAQCEKLKHVDLEGCDVALCDDVLDILTEKAHQLCSLNVSFCHRMSAQALSALIKRCNSTLQKLQMWGCSSKLQNELANWIGDGTHLTRKDFQLVGF
eukprot:CAMPEP_0201560430 /NCGR_PEP_ID=MMETSP0173_2-20130828/78266_1 /ASSEMBLY_ACC=CAM_ASM_000268 /TAXON_ID=218659 /ORGANISM="Vexillifera sp., Strain DIVA3 564/2" /LENGTH=564 /DNA_ID=CAMNT_0047974877 /DNA_START=199 /DNA_END=1893 /DNA_ORIENTATION=-